MSDLTPMMKQYLEIKNIYPDAILFFRLGDFYEMFGDDAKTASAILQIALTSRGAGEGRQNKIPMCGVPFHAANSYIMKLISAGKKVAICEQVEDPKAAKGIVKREIIKVVTPGTILEESALDRKSNNYILAASVYKDTAAAAYVDITTGEFYARESQGNDILSALAEEIEKISPAEVLVPDHFRDDKETEKNLMSRLRAGKTFINYCDSWNFQNEAAYAKLKDHFKVMNLEGFGIEGKTAVISAAGALISYLLETQKTVLFHINRINLLADKDSLYLDAAALRNLEVTEPAVYGEASGTLFSVLDNTKTAMGARLLKKWLRNPLADAKKINARLELVDFFTGFSDLREDLRETMAEIADIERIAGKIGSQNVNARDLVALKKSLETSGRMAAMLAERGPDALKASAMQDDGRLKDTAALIEQAIEDEPPITIKEGGIIKAGYNDELKKLRDISVNGKSWIAALQEQERKKTGISSLKVGYTSVFGYFIEISKANLKNVPEEYIRKQTLVNGERFITPELKEYEATVLGAQEKIRSMEYEIFTRVRDEIGRNLSALQALSASVAAVDCIISLAVAAVNNNYTRPKVSEGQSLVIEEGRHPVVEKALGASGFIPNNAKLDCSENMIMVITGPNMAGKSTYMRQVALIVIMAQAGSFVPAQKAEIGVVDRIFTRVGASDFLSRGQSTFMVEMLETANIMNNATSRSLILLDEVGRGTSTFDGVSIAWAITEYIHNRIKAKTLFATHYYELTETEDLLPGVKNYNIQVKEWKGRIVFLRKIVQGSTDRSYGIHVGQLAGLPDEVIGRAEQILADLENANYTKDGRTKLGAGNGKGKQAAPQMSLFDTEPAVISELKKLDIDSMSPVDALLKLKEFKEKNT